MARLAGVATIAILAVFIVLMAAGGHRRRPRPGHRAKRFFWLEELATLRLQTRRLLIYNKAFNTPLGEELAMLYIWSPNLAQGMGVELC